MANRFKVATLVLNSQDITTNGNRLRIGNSGVLYSGENYGGFITNSNLAGLCTSGNLESTGTALQTQITNALSTKVTGVSISGGIGITGAFNINAGTNVTLTQQGTNTLSISATAGETSLDGLMSTGSHALINSVTGVSISGGLGFTGNFNINAGSNISLNQQGSNTLQINTTIPQGFLSSGDADNKYATFTQGITGISINGATAISGAISINSNSGILLTQIGNSFNISPTGWFSKSITIENPVPGDNITLFYTQNAIQVQRLKTIIRGAGLGSGQFSILSYPDRTAAGTSLLTDNFVCTGRTTGDNFISFSNSTISGENWTWLKIIATGQTLSGLGVTMFYKNLY